MVSDLHEQICNNNRNQTEPVKVKQSEGRGKSRITKTVQKWGMIAGSDTAWLRESNASMAVLQF
jgi:hypothetical protein